MRRRQIYAQPNRNAMAALPGTVAEAGQGSPSAPAPQGITYQHDERVTVTLPIEEFKGVKLEDQTARMAGLDKAVAMMAAANPEGPLHVNFGGINNAMREAMAVEKRKGGRPKGSKNKAKH